MPQIPIGHRGEMRVLVTTEYSIDFLGLDDARVLGTPWMIMLMEWTCRNSVSPLLEAGYDTVGTDVHVKHVSAAPMGSPVVFTSEVLSVNERRVNFRVECKMGDIVIGEGTHERGIIHIQRFAEKMKARLGSR